MSMSKKDYVAIAAIVHRRFASNISQRIQVDFPPIRQFIEDLTDYLAEDNPNFDQHRFRKACGF